MQASERLQSFKFLAQYFGHDMEKFEQVVNLAITSIDGAVFKIRKAVEDEDEMLLKEGFHTLKGNLTHLELKDYLDKMPEYDDPDLYAKSHDYALRVQEEIDKIKSDLSLDS